MSYYDNAAATSTYPTPTVTDSGAYFIVVNTGFCSDTAQVNAVVRTTPNLVITDPTAVCSPNKIDLTANAVTVGSTLNGGTLSYYDNAAATSTYPTPTVSDSGAYFIVANTGFCSDTAQVNALVNPKPILVISDPDTACFPMGVDLTAASVTVGSTLEGGILSYYRDAAATNVHNSPTVVSTGTYYILAATAQGCSDTAAVNVMVESVNILANGINPTQCNSSTGAVIISGIDPNTDYRLSYNTVMNSSVTSNASGEIVISNLPAGNYEFIRVSTVTHGCGNDALPSVILTDPNAPFVDAGNTQKVCEGAATTLLATTNGSSTITWNKGRVNGVSFVQTNNTELYTVQADSNNCIGIDTVTITVVSNPTGSITSTPDCRNQLVEVSALEGTNSTFSEWLISNNGIDYSSTVESQMFTTAIQSVWYKAIFTNIDGCTTEMVEEITLCPLLPLVIPTAITANNDGENDTFWIDNIWLYPNNQIQIFNRWGTKVYNGHGYDNEWDGGNLPVGPYYYVLELNDGTGKNYQGTINLLRP